MKRGVVIGSIFSCGVGYVFVLEGGWPSSFCALYTGGKSFILYSVRCLEPVMWTHRMNVIVLFYYSPGKD